ncbi:FG-GAP repeat protein, partial [Hymenobacter sp. BT664]
GDLNGDGYADLAAGAYLYTNGQASEGAVFVYYGGATGLQTVPANPAAAALRLESNQANAAFGASVAGVGDLNGDGYADLAAGAPLYANGQSQEGAAFVYYGGATGLQTVPANPAAAALRLESNTPTARMANSLAGASDLNGDGYADLAIGAPQYTGGQSQAGAVFVYYGGSTGSSNRDTRLRLYNANQTTLLSAANRAQATFGLGLRAASPYGRVRARLVWETKANGVPFSSSSAIPNSTQYTARGPWTNLPATGAPPELKVLVNKVGHVTRVRVRVEYATTSPLVAGTTTPPAGTGGVSGRARYGPWRYVGAQQLGQSSGPATPLPVTLTAFTAERRGRGVRLRWTTASEQNSDFFAVERSPDGRTFASIGRVAAQGHSPQAVTYEFTDSDLPAAPARVLYYRLRQIDLDGTATYSPVRAVAGETDELTLFPNPARNGDPVRLSGAAPQVPVTVLDLAGRVRGTTYTTASGQALLEPATGDLPTGLYVVRAGAQATKLVVE